MIEKVLRGEIYSANLDPIVGSEQGGERPVIILQNNVGNKYSPTLVTAAITSHINKKRNMPTHVPVICEGLEQDSVVLLEQIRTIDRRRLIKKIGTVSVDNMAQIEKALLVSVGMGGRNGTKT